MAATVSVVNPDDPVVTVLTVRQGATARTVLVGRWVYRGHPVPQDPKALRAKTPYHLDLPVSSSNATR